VAKLDGREPEPIGEQEPVSNITASASIEKRGDPADLTRLTPFHFSTPCPALKVPNFGYGTSTIREEL